MRAEEYRERELLVAGWPVNLSSYRMGAVWHSKADNVSPGAALCRAVGETREAAEDMAVRRAENLLQRTRRHAV